MMKCGIAGLSLFSKNKMIEYLTSKFGIHHSLFQELPGLRQAGQIDFR
ncbi:hypothetical protein D1AOALGA4SA_5425 [Olavius algarvensis Delta 1 endosymbiont]|nr:hypothetical protein D1AOALGA4SA_5425 [Olavius algarvensis Delta 1 endosymbiont]